MEASGATDPMEGICLFLWGDSSPTNVEEMLMKKKNWPELAALTSVFSVELPGIEPELLPGEMLSELQFHYVTVRFSPARYLLFVLGS